MVVLLKNNQNEFSYEFVTEIKGYDDHGKKNREHGFRKHLFSIKNMWLPDVLKNRVPEVFSHFCKNLSS